MTWLLWVLLTAFLVVEVVATELESLTLVTVTAAAALVILALWSDVFAIIVAHPLLSALCVPAYFVIGTAWSFWKWGGLIAARLLKFEAEKVSLLDEHGRGSWKDRPFEDFVRQVHGYPPAVSKNKERITTWIVAWPFSVTWAILKWPREFAVKLYERLASTFQRMADRAFAGKLGL